MCRPMIGERVLIDDHPEVPEEWRSVWARVASYETDDDRPVIMLMDVMGRTIRLCAEYVTEPAC